MKTKVQDVMTHEVVAVGESTPFKQLVALLARRRISAVPVVDAAERVVGVVSEADLLLKEELRGAGRHAPRFERHRHRVERAKAAGAVARELMTSPAVTVNRDTSVLEAARLLHAKGVTRLPVEDALGRLVGIVSRSDLLASFRRPDEEIRREILEDLIRHDLLMSPERFDVKVRDGLVVLQGCCERRSLIPILVRAVESVAGVVRVENRLGYEVDDVRESYGSLTHTF
jgi:CBS domain-containing protein